MDTNRILIEPFDALGDLDGKRIYASAIRAVSVILVSLGAGEIVIPTPGDALTRHIRDSVSSLPKQRRSIVRLADTKGTQFKRVLAYLAPLKEQATEWPETAFVNFAANSLYLLTLARENNASLIDGDISEMHSFLSIIRPQVFRNEAKYRLGELFHLFTMYRPALLDQTILNGQVADPSVRQVLSNIIDSSEFRDVVASNGRLGYLRQPKVGLGRVKKAVLRLSSKREFSTVVRAGMTASSLAPAPLNVSSLKDLIPNQRKLDRFAPPSIDLPASMYFDICKAALTDFDPRATSARGTLFAHVSPIGGTRWIQEGEESKLRYNPKSVLRNNQMQLSKALMRSVDIVKP